MGLYDDVVAVPRRTMVLFFVVDTSGSMTGEKIGAVNQAIEELIPELGSLSEENADAEIKIATLQFSNGASWLCTKPVSAESFQWTYLKADGCTDFGEACSELNKKLSRKEFMNEISGSFAPAIFLLSDGEPTDNYKKELEVLKQNAWFKKAIKVAVAIGEDANKDVLKDFVGNMECVITVHNSEALKKWIRFVSVTASQIGSQSSKAGEGKEDSKEEVVQKQDMLATAIKDEIAETPNYDSEDEFN